MPHSYINWRSAAVACLLAFAAARPRPLPAQVATIGSLTVVVTDDHGTPVSDATVTLERGGKAVRSFQSDHEGMVSIPVLSPARYSVLAEQFGYQPVRMTDVDVVGGGVTRISIRIARRPPPINSVAVVPSNAVISGTSHDLTISGRDLMAFAPRADIGGVPAMLSVADAPRDGRYGLLASGNGLPPTASSLFVDGVHENLLRHPGLPGEPVAPVLFGRDGISDVGFSGLGISGAGPGSIGSTVTAQTRSGGEGFSFRPWATVSSARLGGKSVDNPGDSTATSIQAGVAMGGSLKGDTASWFLRGDYQQLETPSAAPFDAARATTDSSADLNGAIRSAAQALGSRDIASWLAPTVRTWKGGSGEGRLDWRFGASTLLAVRAGGASWTETNPLVGSELVNGAGSSVKATDMSAAAILTVAGEQLTSESRIGVRSSKRDWTGAALPYTGIVGDAVAFGGAGTLPGHFKDGGISGSESVTYRADDHTLQGGLSYDSRVINYDWLPGSAGVYQFGDLASFAAGQGSFYQALRSNPVPDLRTHVFSGFVQDSWHAAEGLDLLFGVRVDYEGVPPGVVAANANWQRISALRNTLLPHDVQKQDIAPRAGFAWDVSGTGQTVLHGAAAMVPGQFDLAALAEAVQYDGDVSIRRSTGTLAWPLVGGGTGTTAGQSLTMFADSVRKPRAFKSELSLQQRLGAGTTVTIGGAYRHADYMLQRTDLNRAPGTASTGDDGRPIFGVLEQYGSLLVPKVGSNRRFADFDMAYSLAATGYTDYSEASVVLEHRMSRGFDLLVGYTYSKTSDNLPGSLTGNPADQLSPFPNGLGGARWEDGRSDLDIPNRVAATLTYASAAKQPLTVAARFRYRSGLPFTPGFRNGVDANGDGSGSNDPVFVSSTTPGLAALISANSCLGSQAGQFAARNSCRDNGVAALDLQASLPIAHGWAVTVDGFNLVGTTTGLFDHAAVLVDPKGTITTDASGHTVLPLMANPGFGQLLSRRGDPRTIRIGFRVEN